MKIKKETFYSIVLLIFFISACKKWKYNTTDLKVVVWDYYASKSIPHAKVFLKEKTTKTSFGYNPTGNPFKCSVLLTQKTGTDGMTVFKDVSLRKKEDYFYGTGCGEAYGKYFGDGSACFDGEGFNKTNPETDTIKFYFSAYLNFKFSPPAPYLNGDTTVVAFLSRSLDYKGNKHYSFFFDNINDSGGGVNNAEIHNGTYDVTITRVKSGVKTIEYDVITFEAYETKDYVVTF